MWSSRRAVRSRRPALGAPQRRLPRCATRGAVHRARRAHGPTSRRAPLALDGGSFLGQPVSLGEVMTDGAGRLVILPGRGAAYRHGHPSLTSYAGNRRRRVRRPDPRDGASRAPAAGGRPRMGDHDTAELRPGNGDRPGHALRRRTADVRGERRSRR
ncbi:MAG: LodA/GoxA family CTQ-dependent oxidase, partial [Solirubrobacteraceae bacterium]